MNNSANAVFSFDRTSFFSVYKLDPFQLPTQPSHRTIDLRFTCQLYNKVCICLYALSDDLKISQALLSVLKAQLHDMRDKDTGIERCECHVQEEPNKPDCRLVFKMVCRHGDYLSCTFGNRMLIGLRSHKDIQINI